MCGVYGLKPTYGLVSTKGVTPLAWSLDHAGPMARSVPDLALMLNYIAGYDPEDPASIHAPLPDYTQLLNKGINGLKIGIPTFYLEGLDPDVEKGFSHAIQTLQQLGAQVRELHIPALSMSAYTGYVITTGEASAYHYRWLQTRSREYAPDVRIFFKSGVLTSAPQYLRAQQVRRVLLHALKKAFTEVDVLAGPTVPISPPSFEKDGVKLNLNVTKRCMPFTSPANATGMPSLSVPMGLNGKGLPMGMQFIGDHHTEPLLLQVANAWQQTNPLRLPNAKLSTKG
ncbi:amidase [Ammoniphilus sp. YIM 78166]|uniref:amidase n=1 Tax=Ammoniphilus sp. YIM 78166 TaxID=1644106 RepID=UPI00106FB6B3|nr:amidase [Ammoniphilus sp. YIM 78166]